jgi:hypothetical protein
MLQEWFVYRAGASPTPVQIGDPIECAVRLCRPVLRKAFGFPGSAGTLVLLSPPYAGVQAFFRSCI